MNVELGYGKVGEWNREEYEKQQRIIKQKQRGVDFSKYRDIEPEAGDW